jgi:uncharacterized circularly permuted ATP-grasp superfamily protein
MQTLSSAQALVNRWMQDHGAQFAVVRQGQRQVMPEPFDPIPRKLSGAEFTHLEQGLIQRINALNLFLNDIYHDRMILRDGVIPEEFVFSSPDFRAECMNLTPAKGIYTHITATDLIRTTDGTWYAMDDSLSVPDGITYPHFARKLCREQWPEEYQVPTLCDNCGLDILLSQLYRDIQEDDPALEDGIVVLLSEGEDSLSAFELHYMASLTGAVVAQAEELIVMDNKVYYRAPEGGFQRVSIIHRLALDRMLDPLCFDEKTPCGVPHLMEVYCAGNIAILNAPGCSVAEDRGLNCFIPQMIRYYLDEEPILPGVPTYLPWYPGQKSFILSHMDSLIFKEVGSDRRTGSIWGAHLDAAQREALAQQIEAEPRRFIAQEVLDVEKLPVTAPDGTSHLARCDFRAYTVHSDSIRVWMGGLSRFTVPDPNGAAISGFKDTWVLSE